MIGVRIIAVLSLVLSPVLTIPSLYQPRANWTGHIQPKKEIRSKDSLEKGYHVLTVGEWASVTSPGYPGNYHNNADLRWEIVPADWETGYLDVWCHNHMFHIRGSRNCNADRLTISYSNNEDSYCNKKKPPGYIKTTETGIEFHFKSDASGNDKGFLCQIRAMGSRKKDPIAPLGCGCGYANTNRIVNGEPSRQNEFPWLVAVVDNGKIEPFCGGALYNSEWIITAAHCVEWRSDPSTWQVLLGMYNWKIPYPDPIRHSVSQVIPHKQHENRAARDSDIALMKLSTPVKEFNERVRPVCLPRAIVDFAGHKSYTTGWGDQGFGKGKSDMAHKVEYPIRSHQECVDNYHDHPTITDNKLCAGNNKFDPSVCPGDSGGPLTVKMLNRHYLVGVVTFSDECDKQIYYDGFTYVPNYMSFIISNAGDQCA